MLFTAQWMSYLFPNYQGLNQNQVIQQVTIDSRVKGNQSLFIPLAGEHFDGHDYAGQALKNGAIALLWDQSRHLPENMDKQTAVFFVDDTLAAMQKLARAFRDEINPIVIGVTGSNGKTTTKELLRQVVATSFKTHYTRGNLNNQIGVPLTILEMERDTDVLILEMGMNHFGEIELLSMIAKPDYGVITNIGESHIEFLGSREGIARAKMEISAGLKESGILIVDGDEPLLDEAGHSARVINCGFADHNDVIVAQPVMNAHGMRFSVSNAYAYTLPLLGKHNALNASFAITIATYLGMTKEAIDRSFQALEQTSMRFEQISGPNGVTLINDAYNASPTSMKAAIDVISQMPAFEQKVLVLGDILELGASSASFHQSIGQVIDEDMTAVFTYGDMAKEITDRLGERQVNVIREHFDSKDALLDALYPYITMDTVILFKASRKMQFETLIECIGNSYA